ncbi:MAG TPA: hypothetical protein VIW68_07305 [Candidatus Sulfotelmatobacter sp.]
MSRMSAYTRLLKSVAITITMLATGLAVAQAPAGPHRPSAVPADYLITPFGYFHPSCVSHTAKGDIVRHDENVIQHANGTTESIHVCAYPHFKSDGEKITGDEQSNNQPTIGHAWVEYASTTTKTSFGYMYAYWNVPPAPSTNDGQTVYLFPGLEDINDVVTIVQPVLGWNSDYASAWGIASWNCCASGTVFEAPPAPVNSGDVIDGYMFDTCAAGTLSCPTWDIVTWDTTSGNFSEMLNTSSQGQTFNWAFAGALEVYNIVQCGDYPSNGSISFYNVNLFNDKFVKIPSPSWSVTNLSSGLTPQCGYGGSLPKQLTLTY